MDEKKVIFITGGGTGGHVYPGIAIANSLGKVYPDYQIKFIGICDGVESKLVPQAGFEINFVRASGMRGLGLIAKIKFLLNLSVGLFQSLVLLIKNNPVAVIGTGGYVSVPVLLAARIMRCQIFIQEQNSIPGSSNKLLAKFADRIFLGFKTAEKYFPAGKSIYSGNPVRQEFWETKKNRSNSSFNVLVFGGSSGALTINNVMLNASKDLFALGNINLYLQTGDKDMQNKMAIAYKDFAKGSVVIDSYIDEMPDALNWADLVVCRAGAMSLAEVATTGKPSVLVPYPYATDDHQFYNATEFSDAGAAIVVRDECFTSEFLVEAISDLRNNTDKLKTMSDAAFSLSSKNSSGVIACSISEILDGKNNVS